MRLVRPSALLLLAITGFSGCGSSPAPKSSSSTTRTTSSARHHTTAKPQPGAQKGRLPPIRRTLRVRAPGTTLSVTIQSVIDPLRDSGAALPPGSRAIGVMAEIVNDGPGSYDSSSSGDFSVVSSSGAALPVFAPHGQCQTPLRDWDNEIAPGETRRGCLVFSIASAARILAVRFSPDARPRGRVSWSG